ncbi:hypothetical protein ACQJBY_001142 [Aegilops geniculata]
MVQEQKGETSSGMYTYKHHGDKGVDIHEIFVKKSRTRVLLSYCGLILLLAIVCRSLLGKEKLCLESVWSVTFGILVAKCLQYKPVKKESVVIMPSFGVQLQIHFWRQHHSRILPQRDMFPATFLCLGNSIQATVIDNAEKSINSVFLIGFPCFIVCRVGSDNAIFWGSARNTFLEVLPASL